VEDWRWVSFDELREDLRARPDAYSYWLRVALERDEWRRLPLAAAH
jgi:isopentenyldiphosphate isomerase